MNSEKTNPTLRKIGTGQGMTKEVKTHMKILLLNDTIPGTNLKRADLGGLTGMAFLDQLFMVSDGVMLSQIRKIAGIDGSTLQNWTKRGWVPNAQLKRYGIDQVAHILLINMLRSCLQLDRIAWLLQYVNGSVEDRDDDIITASALYDSICKTLDYLDAEEECTIESIRPMIERAIVDYVEPVEGARERLTNALEIIVSSYCASMIKRASDAKMKALMGTVEE
jgi:hypothetical protein